MTHRTFVISLVSATAAATLLMFCGAHYLNGIDSAYNENDLIRQYQMAKLEKLPEARLVVLGDSSAGNGIDARTLGELSGLPVANMALTGSFGLAGTYNMIRHVERSFSPEYILIVHSLDTWNRGYSSQGNFETLGSLTDTLSAAVGIEGRFETLKYLFNPKEIGLYIENALHTKVDARIADDYLMQRPETYASGRIAIRDENRISEHIHPETVLLFQEVDRLCGEIDARCVYAHGPIHEDVFRRSEYEVGRIHDLVSSAEHIGILDQIFVYPGAMMGDTLDHVDARFRGDVTRDYYHELVESISLGSPSR